jgi:hypothetical protein
VHAGLIDVRMTFLTSEDVPKTCEHRAHAFTRARALWWNVEYAQHGT